jgi:hypothetical protein
MAGRMDTKAVRFFLKIFFTGSHGLFIYRQMEFHGIVMIDGNCELMPLKVADCYASYCWKNK